MTAAVSYAQAPAQNRWIADNKKNGCEVLRVELSNYRGVDLCNCRIWFDAGNVEMRPGREGFALKVGKLPQLQAAIGRAIEAARAGRMASVSGRRSRDKGARGEREVAGLLRSHGFLARRGVQYQGGSESPDVAHEIDGLHIEVKRTEAFQLYRSIEQAKNERKAGDIPAVFHRANGRPWVVVLEADDFLTVMRALIATAPLAINADQGQRRCGEQEPC